MTEQHEVIIVGGGLSGLAAAHFLHKKRPELSILLLEKDSRPGGAVRSFEEKGYLAEWGPHGFLDNTPESMELLTDLGLDRQVQRAPLGNFVRFVCHRGQLVQLPQKPQQLLTTPLLTVGGKLRLLGDLWRRPRSEDQTIGQWAAHRFGPEVLPLVDAAVTGSFAGDYERLSIGAVMPGVRRLEQTHGSVLRGLLKKRKEKSGPSKGLPAMLSFPQGLERLVQELARGKDIRLQTAVAEISRREGRWHLTADGATYQTENLIVALGVNQALNLLNALSPSPPVRRIPEATIANVAMGYTAAAQVPYGFGYLAPEREKRFTLGALFSSHMFPGRAPAGHVLLEALVGGRRHPERLQLSDQELTERVYEDLRELLVLPSPPKFSRVLRPPMGIPQLEMDHPALLAWRQKMEASQPGLSICGFGWDGIGINDVVKAARRSAEAVATGLAGPGEEAKVKPVYF